MGNSVNDRLDKLGLRVKTDVGRADDEVNSHYPLQGIESLKPSAPSAAAQAEEFLVAG